MKSETIRECYEKRILTFLGRIHKSLQDAGFLVSDVEENSDDQYKWSFTVHVDGDKDRFGDEDIGIDFTICESQIFDGTNEGINFELLIVACGGRILGSMAPFNFTIDVWVSRRKDVEKRFQIFEDMDVNEVVQIVRKTKKVKA
jgi:hypothetical protein